MAQEQTEGGHPSPDGVSDVHEAVWPNPEISRADPDAEREQFVVGAPTEEPREFPGVTNAHIGSDGQWQPARQGHPEEKDE